ncbi:MAG TPA: TIGR02186 family protein [Desulfomonilaceae bacterium]|nr:TIGR02186 family protein [Desulfomonilaceae bacterium]
MRAGTVYVWTVMLFGLFLQAVSTPNYVIAAGTALRVEPNKLHVSESFRGALVTISADIPKGAGAIVEIEGATHDDRLLRQGRRGGLWMSVGEVTVQGAPSVYLVETTPDLASHPDTGAQWGYEALQKRMAFSGAIPEDGVGVLFEQFVRLKESEGLYGLFPRSLKPTRASENHTTVEGEFVLPSNIAPGNYRVVLSVLNSGKLLERQSAEFSIDMTGLPGFLASLAYHHAALYGLAAVVIAIVTGFVMGILFTSKGSH